MSQTSNKTKDQKIAELRELVALISSSTEGAIAAYEAGQGDFPSLDQLDVSLGPKGLHHHIRILESACTQLCTTLTPPLLTLFSKSLLSLETACLRIIIRAKISDILLQFPTGLHVSEIAKKARIESGKLARILRLLSMKHIFREDVFANSRLSYMLHSEDPTADFIVMLSEEFFVYAHANFYDALIDSDYGSSYDANKSPFAYGIRHEMKDAGMFDWLQQHPDKQLRFSRAMTSDRFGHIWEFFPLDTLSEGTVWCDVGGGHGHIFLEMSKLYPHFQLVLQDLPNVLKQSTLYWEEGNPTALKEGRIKFVPINFLEQSPESGADFYYLRHIIHDWPDHDAVTILQNVRKVMKPTSRVLIHDYVLPSLASRELADAPKPLMPTYGAGNWRSFMQDINMMVALNAKERTISEFKELGKQAGLELVKPWEGVENSILEFKLKGPN